MAVFLLASLLIFTKCCPDLEIFKLFDQLDSLSDPDWQSANNLWMAYHYVIDTTDYSDSPPNNYEYKVQNVGLGLYI